MVDPELDPLPLPEPLRSRTIFAVTRWEDWCARHDVRPDGASISQLEDCVREHQRAGVDSDELVDLLDHGAAMSALWDEPRWSSLTLEL
jgi:hypothetical protein